ncbi:MAG: PqqD family protein [Cyanobacteriota bacterium]|nr:PqqD family protein [Cyanobacteriota bacterium]
MPALFVPLQRNPVICAAELDGEVCLFHPERGEYLNLNASGSAIWNLLATPLERDELISRLVERYAVEVADCRRDTERFLTLALERGMLLEDATSP